MTKVTKIHGNETPSLNGEEIDPLRQLEHYKPKSLSDSEKDVDLEKMENEKFFEIDDVESLDDRKETPLNKLIDELHENRSGIKNLLGKVREYSSNLELLLPKGKEWNSRYSMDLKMKTLNEIVGTELSVLKQLDDSIKTEFELRRKAESKDEDVNLNSELIRSIADKLLDIEQDKNAELLLETESSNLEDDGEPSISKDDIVVSDEEDDDKIIIDSTMIRNIANIMEEDGEWAEQYVKQIGL
jgi:hypothetical protein